MPEVIHVDVAQALSMLDEGAFLLDVREPEEWAAGHAPVAVHVPMASVGASAERLPGDRRIVCICRSGGRSTAVAEALVGAGYDAVNLAGGMQAWAGAGQAVVDDRGGPGVVV
ncbi:MAG TPA: rhodanese-like domain-containing protein [Acidimicrobiales bacterium]|nr:rhodanese-like domain-containing protein [Acidimicrobiales bacterium]